MMFLSIPPVMQLAWAMLIVLLGAGCASKPVRVPQVITPSSAPAQRARADYPSVALVLGGGTLRGFAHVGVIKALEAHGIRPQIIVGTSAGSLVGALYAAGLAPDALERAALEARLAQFTDYSLWGLGLIKGEALQEFVNEHVERRPIEALKIAFAAVAADFQTGQMRVFNRGDTGMAVRASSAVPGVFHPVAIEGRRYVDGSLVSPVPVCVARQMGADFVIAADVWYLPQHTSIDNPLNIPFQILHIMAQALSAHQIKAADVAIRPDITKAGRVSFSNRAALISAGEEATLAAVPEIKLLLSTIKSTPRAKAVTDSCPP